MIGSSYEVQLKDNKCGGATLTVSEQADYSAKEEVLTYNVPLSSLKSLEKIINEYKIPSWQKLKANPIFAYDADTVSLRFKYADGETIIVHSTQLLPNNGGEAFRDVLDFMKNAIQA